MVSLITKYLCSFDDFPQKTVDSSSIIRTIIQNTWVYRLCTRDEGFKSEQRTSTPPRSIKTFLQNVKSYMMDNFLSERNDLPDEVSDLLYAAMHAVPLSKSLALPNSEKAPIGPPRPLCNIC